MKRISQRDIARQLGINVSTVSRALRGGEGVSSELRQRIMQLADEQGYRPNPFAVSLRYDTTRTIGIIVPDISFNHYAHIVKFIEAEARKKRQEDKVRLEAIKQDFKAHYDVPDKRK